MISNWLVKREDCKCPQSSVEQMFDSCLGRTQSAVCFPRPVEGAAIKGNIWRRFETERRKETPLSVLDVLLWSGRDVLDGVELHVGNTSGRRSCFAVTVFFAE